MELFFELLTLSCLMLPLFTIPLGIGVWVLFKHKLKGFDNIMDFLFVVGMSSLFYPPVLMFIIFSGVRLWWSSKKEDKMGHKAPDLDL